MAIDFKKIIEKLVSADLDFVLVGGFAAAAYGSSLVTYDLDICALTSPENIKKLRKALKDINPRHRISQTKPSFLEEPKVLEGINHIYLETDLGVLDILSTITGVGDFESLKRQASEINVFGHKCKIISISDLLKSKKSLKRPKDLEVAIELEAIISKLKKD